MKKKFSNKSGYHCKGNVITPINWFGGIVETVLIPTGAWQHNNWFGVACFILAVVMFSAYCTAYFYFAFTNPDRLQSEEYNLHQQELSVTSGNEIRISDETPRIIEGCPPI